AMACVLTNGYSFITLGSWLAKGSHVQFDDIPFLDNIIALYHLSIVFLCAPDTGEFEMGGKILVHCGRHFHDRATAWHGEGRAQVRFLARGFGIDSDDVEQRI